MINKAFIDEYDKRATRIHRSTTFGLKFKLWDNWNTGQSADIVKDTTILLLYIFSHCLYCVFMSFRKDLPVETSQMPPSKLHSIT